MNNEQILQPFSRTGFLHATPHPSFHYNPPPPPPPGSLHPVLMSVLGQPGKFNTLPLQHLFPSPPRLHPPPLQIKACARHIQHRTTRYFKEGRKRRRTELELRAILHVHRLSLRVDAEDSGGAEDVLVLESV